MRKMVCFDMDMTLLDHAVKKIPESALAAIQSLKKQGHLVVIASGRDMDNELSRPWADAVEPDAIVHSNGQKVTVGRKVLKEVFMDGALIRRLVEFAKEHNFCLGFNIGRKGCYVHEEIIRDRERRVFKEPDREFIPVENLFSHPFYAMALFGWNPEHTQEAARLVEEHFPELKCPLFSRKEGADVIYRNVSKADGIRILMDYYGVEEKDVVAFGDSMNDIEMIREAGIGVAMGNAVEELKREADFVTKAIGQDGIQYGLFKIGLLEDLDKPPLLS